MTTPRKQPSDYLTFREAEDRYVAKADLASTTASLTAAISAVQGQTSSLHTKMDSIVSRDVLEVHWKRDDERNEQVNEKLNGLKGDIANVKTEVKGDIADVQADIEIIKSNRFPSWFPIVVAAVIGAVLGPVFTFLLVKHF